METKRNLRPISILLLSAVIAQGLYFLALIFISVFYRQLLAVMGAETALIEGERPLIYFTLGGGFVMLFFTAVFSCWIYRSVHRGKGYRFPCIFVFIIVGLATITAVAGSQWEPQMIGRYQGALMLQSYSLLNIVQLYVSPLQSVSMLLLVIGVVLAMCQRTVGRPKQAILLLRVAAVGQGVYFIGILLVTLFQKGLRPLVGYAEIMEELMAVPMQIPHYQLVSGGLALGVTIVLMCWISASLRNEKSPKIPCVCAFVFLGLIFILYPFGSIEQMSMMTSLGINELLALSMLLQALNYLSSVFTINLYLLAIGSALALYRPSITSD